MIEAYMHIKFHVGQGGDTAWCVVVSLDQGCHGFQCVLNVLSYKPWHSIDLLEMLPKQCASLPVIVMQPCMCYIADDTLSYYQGRMMIAQAEEHHAAETMWLVSVGACRQTLFPLLYGQR